jgi:ATP-dependent helicase Lhr and Lhr-like helicase
MSDCRDSRPLGSPPMRKEVLSAFFGEFRSLRPVQRDAFHPILEGSDALILSPTGSGKTEGAIAPLVTRLWDELNSDMGPVIIYVSPTKALANDLHQRLIGRCEQLGIRLGLRHGDRSDLTRRTSPGILITTPESLDVLLSSRNRPVAYVRALVVDEIHLLYNVQRGLQLSVLIRRLELRLNRRIQIIGMSATLANADELIRFFFGTSRSPAPRIIRDSSRKPLASHIRILSDLDELSRLLARVTAIRPTKLLIFANSRRECDRIGAQLSAAQSNLPPVYVHHSSQSRASREEVEERFARDRSAICVATSTLELGVDIGDIDAVLLYGVPPSVESFLQRIGRGNRRSNESSVVCLVPPESKRPTIDALAYHAIIKRAESGSFESEPAFTLFGAAVQQILSHLRYEKGGYVRTADFAALFASQPHLEESVVSDILSQLAEAGVLVRHDYKHRYCAGDGFHRLESFRLIYGNYPAAAQTAGVISNERELGRIPIVNLLRLESGTHIRFAGRTLRVRRVLRDRIEVEPGVASSPIVELTYLGNRPGIHPQILSDIRALIENQTVDYEILSPKDRSSIKHTVEHLSPLLRNGATPVVKASDGFHHLVFGGSLFNRAIASVARDYPLRFDDVSVTTSSPIDVRTLPCSLQEFVDLLPSETEGQTLFQGLLPATLARFELNERWLKTPAHGVSLARLRTGPIRLVEQSKIPGFL